MSKVVRKKKRKQEVAEPLVFCTRGHDTTDPGNVYVYTLHQCRACRSVRTAESKRRKRLSS